MTKPRRLTPQEICEAAYAKLPGHGYTSFKYIRSKGTKQMLLNFTAAVLKVLEELEAQMFKPQAPTEPICGKAAAGLIPRWGEYFACVLNPGHDGECCSGGECVKHGKYVGHPGVTPQCPEWPKCVEATDAD